ncbi:MAG: asparagine synthetase B family protein [Candidatus Rokuibacteriota bacterium]
MAGVVHRDAARPVEGSARAGLARPGCSDERPATLSAPGLLLQPWGEGAYAEARPDALVGAALDISNLEELVTTSGAASPGEALERLYRREGTRFLTRLRGAFALAIWLPAERRLLLAGDRFGIRRIYYAATQVGLAFGPRLPSVFALLDVPSELDPSAAFAYMNFGTVPAPQSMYRAVRRLPPGHALVWEDGQVAIRAYWDITYTEARRSASVAAAEMVGHAEEAVRHALDGAGPKTTGAFLSGGTDSSTIVGLMTRLTGERAHAFSIGFREQRYDELGYAQLAAQHFGAAHYTRLVTPDDAFACLPDLVSGYDEPFGNNSAIPTYLCARMARDAGMERLLAGDGGDEIFGGNERYRKEQILARYALIPKAIRTRLIEPGLRACPAGSSSLLGKAQRYVRRASQANPDRFYTSEFLLVHEADRLLDGGFVAMSDRDWPLQVARRHYGAARATSELNRLLYLDMKVTLGDNDLLKVSRAAELAGVAIRFPMLDHPLVEFAATLPARDKVRGTEKRYLFKRAFASLLPREVLAKAKHGFGLPISDWLKTHGPFRELARDTLLSTRSRQRGYYAPHALEDLFRRHEEDTTPYYGDVLWSLLMLELWHHEREAAA